MGPLDMERVFGEDFATKIRMAFKVWDFDRSGFLTSDEIVGILTRPGGGAPMTEADAVAFVKKHDQNKDGKLDLDELSEAIAANWMNKTWEADDDVEAAARAQVENVFGDVPGDTTDADVVLMDRLGDREERLAQ